MTTPLTLTRDVAWPTLTTFKTGGTARTVVTVRSLAELTAALDLARREGLPYCLIGGGSNVLAPDGEYAGLVIVVALTGIAIAADDGETVRVRVAAGEPLDALVAWTVAHGYWGIENLTHIPGTVGAAPVQNVGAYGVEMGDVVVEVVAYDPTTAREHTFQNEACRFGYRDSFFKSVAGRHLIITSVTMQLSRTPRPQLSYPDLVSLAADAPDLADIRQAVATIRSRKFPNWHEVGTAGSFFKNPIISEAEFRTLRARYPELPGHALPDGRIKLSLGWILDKLCDYKGVREGAVGTHVTQALVVVNYGGASTGDVLDFTNRMAAAVTDATGITLEREVTLLPTGTLDV